MTLVDIEAPQQVRRDRWGRYLVTPPDGGKPVGYQRATTLAKMLEDTSNLTRWSARMTLLGAAQRPDIIASVLAADPSDRKTLDKLAEQAKEHGGANVRRDLGTAVHKFLELAHADATYTVPEPYTADIAAIQRVLDDAGFDVVPEYSERILVVDSIQVAGMCDMVLRRRSDGLLFIADLKTGSSVQYGALGWAVQLSIYSQADNIYEQGQADDGSDDRRLPMPTVDRSAAFIIHCEPQSGSAQLHQLTIGAEFVDLAVAVREVRKRRDLLVPFEFEGGGTTSTSVAEGTANADAAGEVAAVVGTVDDPTPDAAALAMFHEARTAWLINRTTALVERLSKAHVAEVWPTDIARPGDIKAGTATWSMQDQNLISMALDALEAKHDVPFGDEDPLVTARRRAEVEAKIAAEVAEANAALADTPYTARATDPDTTYADPVEAKIAAEASTLSTTSMGAEVKTYTAQPDGPTADPVAVDIVMSIVKAMAKSEHPDDRERIGRVQAWQRQASNKGVGWKIGGYKRGEVPERLYAIVAAAVGCLDLIDLDATDPDRRVRDLLAAVLDDDIAQQPTASVGALFGLLTTDQALRLAEMAEAVTNTNTTDKEHQQ